MGEPDISKIVEALHRDLKGLGAMAERWAVNSEVVEDVDARGSVLFATGSFLMSAAALLMGDPAADREEILFAEKETALVRGSAHRKIVVPDGLRKRMEDASEN